MKRLIILFCAVVAGAGAWASLALAHGHERRRPAPLRVLLSNDDGATAPGLIAERDALCAAGDDVVVSAPATNESGTSGAITTAPTLHATHTPFRCGRRTSESWAVGGTPADSVFFGLSVPFAHHPPDLVVSGSNAGDNVGIGVTHSGTVGAAMTGGQSGIPSIAVSSGISTTNATATAADYAATAAFMVRLVRRLDAARWTGRPLLPAGTMLNVNYPLVTDAAGNFDAAGVLGARFTKVARLGPRLLGFAPVAGSAGEYSLTLGVCGQLGAAPCPVEPGSDQTALARGYVSVTPLAVTPDSAPRAAPIRRALAGLVR